MSTPGRNASSAKLLVAGILATAAMLLGASPGRATAESVAADALLVGIDHPLAIVDVVDGDDDAGSIVDGLGDDHPAALLGMTRRTRRLPTSELDGVGARPYEHLGKRGHLRWAPKTSPPAV